jgi:hypothetical protein
MIALIVAGLVLISAVGLSFLWCLAVFMDEQEVLRDRPIGPRSILTSGVLLSMAIAATHWTLHSHWW